MNKWFLAIFFLLFAFFASAAIQEPAIFKCEQPWWYERYGNEKFEWTDHNGRTNAVTVAKTNEVIKGSAGWSGATVVFGRDMKWQTYEIKSGHLNEDYSYDVEKIAPGTYTYGKFYTQMTPEEKHAMWAAYTNTVIQAQLKHLEEKYADAKFDVSIDPEEYKKQLMEGRSEDDLTPDEKLEINREYRKYYDEWLRINDPEKWDHPIMMPGKGQIISEQSKKGKNGVGYFTSPEARARRRDALLKKKQLKK